MMLNENEQNAQMMREQNEKMLREQA